MKYNIRLVFGILFVFAGTLIVLQNLNIFPGSTGNILWASLFAATSIFLFSLYFKRRENWWWLLIGLMLFTMMVGNLVALFPSANNFGPLITLFGAGLGFLLIYLIDRRQWWGLIPSGILITLGVDGILHITSPDLEANGIIFLGLGLTFLLLFVNPSKEGRLNWAVIPSTILLAIGLLASFEQGNSVLNYAGPALLLLAGGTVLFYSVNKK